MSNKYLEKIAAFPGIPGNPIKAVSKATPAVGSLAERIAQKRQARMLEEVGAMKGRTKGLPVRR